MSSHGISAWIAALVLFAATPAAAAPGTIFIAEGQVGYTLGSSFAESPDGLATRLTLGVGGKFRGWPTRIYGVFNLGHAALSGRIGSGVDAAETERSWTSWSFGLRLLSPIVRNLRFLGEISLGSGSVETDAVVLGGQERYRTEDDALLVELAIGLQYRVSLHVSVGVRADVDIATNLDAFDLATELAGGDSRESGLMSPSFLATLTLHL